MLGMFTPGKAPLADQVPYWGFAMPDVVLTMSGQLLFFARIRHAAIDARDPADLDVINRSWQKLLGTVEPPHRAFIVFTRPEMELPDDYDRSDDVAGLAQRKRLSFVCSHVRRMQSTLVVAFDPELTSQVDDDQSNWVRQYIRHWAAERSRQPHLNFYLRELIDDAIADCRTRFHGLSSLVKDGTPLEPMSSVEIASLLHYLVNQGQGVFEPSRKSQRYGLNWRLAAEDVSFERTHMVVGNRLVGLYSLALPPQASAANSLGELYSMQADLSIVLEWRGVDRYDATKRIRAVQKHYTNSVRVCSPTSRRVASLRPRSAGRTALTPAPRTLVQTGSCRRCSLIHPLHVVVDVPSRMTLFRATADTERPERPDDTNGRGLPREEPARRGAAKSTPHAGGSTDPDSDQESSAHDHPARTGVCVNMATTHDRMEKATMEQRQLWIATAAVILAVIGGTWSVGQNMATRDDIARVRAEIQANREATEARFDELRTEIQAAQESANSQMEELRGYIVQHLNQHSRDGQ